jgi:rhodanese-related sulfurtransferase
VSTLQWVLLGATLALFGLMLWRRRGDVSPAVAKQLVADGALLLDVRTPGEFAAGHIQGAVNVPLAELQGRVEELAPKERAVVAYCASGMRSAIAAGMLRSAGFSRVQNLGAMSRW